MTIVGHTISDQLEYVFHVDSGKGFGKTTATTDIVCRIATGSHVLCKVGNADVASGDASGTRRSAANSSPLGLTLEIVPERSPYSGSGDLPVRVLFEGQPLAGALVKLTRFEHDAAPVAERKTDSSGRASFPLTANRSWLLNVVWTKRAAAPADVDFDTTFSSLTFGIP